MKQKRIGTLTLGLTLILIGVAVPLSIIFKEKAMVILKFMPLVLVALGIEIIVFAIRRKDEKIIYDGLSIFFAIVITFVSLIGSSISPLIERGIAIEEKRTSVTRSISAVADELDVDASNIYSYISNDFGSSEFLYIFGRQNYTVDDFKFSGFVRFRDIINVDDANEKKSFEENTYQLLSNIKNMADFPAIDSISIVTDIYFDNTSENLYLDFSHKDIKDITLADVEKRLDNDVAAARSNYAYYNSSQGGDYLSSEVLDDLSGETEPPASSEIASSEITSSEDSEEITSSPVTDPAE